MVTFLRIETRADKPVAVFDGGYPQWEPTGSGGSRYDDGTFCLDLNSLQRRIANVEAGLNGPDTSASQEKLALAQMLATGDVHRVEK